MVKGALHHPADGLAGVSDAFQLADHPVHRLDSQCGDSADVTLGHLVQVGSDLIFNLVRDALVLDKFLIDGLKFGLGLGAHRTADEADLPAAYFRKMNDFLLGLVEGKFRRGKRSALNELEAINLLLSLRGRDDPVDRYDEYGDEYTVTIDMPLPTNEIDPNLLRNYTIKDGIVQSMYNNNNKEMLADLCEIYNTYALKSTDIIGYYTMSVLLEKALMKSVEGLKYKSNGKMWEMEAWGGGPCGAAAPEQL